MPHDADTHHSPPTHDAEWASPACARDTAPSLSVVSPFYHDDPTPLFDALGDEIAASPAPDAVEIVFYDDGSRDAGLTERLMGRVARAPFPARLLTQVQNRGRAAARNRLAQAARGRHVLFLDADMLPEGPGFLAAWRALVANEDPGVAFGGFTVSRAPRSPRTALHRALAQQGDCPPALVRARAPAKHVCTSNLLVREDVLAKAPFDETFQGWGWEDVEWAARAAEVSSIRHVDIPAAHMGLATTDALLDRYRRSGANFARFAALHPGLAAEMPSYRAASWFQRWPVLRAARPVFEGVTRDKLGVTPLRVRLLALKLWRASWDGEALA